MNADDLAHPILKGVPATFVAPINEWYSWTPSPRANPDVKVLLTLDSSNFPAATTCADVIAAFSSFSSLSFSHCQAQAGIANRAGSNADKRTPARTLRMRAGAAMCFVTEKNLLVGDNDGLPS